MSIGVGLSPQTRSFAPAATFARVRLQNILQGLASPPLPAKPSESPLLAHCVGWFRSFADAKDQASSLLDGLLKEYPKHCQFPSGRSFGLDVDQNRASRDSLANIASLFSHKFIYGLFRSLFVILINIGIISFFRVYFRSISVIILVLRIIPAPLWIFTNSLRWANVPSSALVVFGIANSGYFW